MKMKIMIVSNSKEINDSMARAIYFGAIYFLFEDEKGREDFEFLKVDHQGALEKFLIEEPQRVIINEYEEDETNGNEDYSRGYVTFKDIKSSAPKNVVVIRTGLSDYNYADYVRLPYEMNKILKLIFVE